MATPLGYQVPTDLNGGTRIMLLVRRGTDFNSRDFINKANKQRQLTLHRARTSLGMPPLRASTRDRIYTPANHQYIHHLYTEYGAKNYGCRISPRLLTNLYNEQFPTENRTRPSIEGYVNRQADLRFLKYSFSR